MRYYATPNGPAVRDAMGAGALACILTPRSRNRLPDGTRWCADNGCYGAGYVGDDAWWAWLTTHAGRDCCDFAVAPDVVADAAATLTRSAPWLPRIRALGIPAAFVAQDGAETVGVPWDELDVLFIGGSTPWKLGRHARTLVTEARRRGKLVHMGRVNSERRMRYADAIGCTSCDGTYLAFGPTQLLPHLLGWLRGVNDQPALWETL